MNKSLYESSDSEIEKETGKSVSEWKKVLDNFCSKKGNGFEDSVKLLNEKHGLSDEWAEAIAIRYQKNKYMNNSENS